jgi:hypothetical protein
MAYDYGNYERQKNDANYRYSTESANNAYGRFISQQRGNRSLSDTSRSFGRQMPQYKSQFGQRGLAGNGVQSGVMQNSMSNYLGDYARGYGRQQQDNTSQLQQFDLNLDNLSSMYQQQLGDFEGQKSKDIALDAAQIDALKALVGGL